MKKNESLKYPKLKDSSTWQNLNEARCSDHSQDIKKHDPKLAKDKICLTKTCHSGKGKNITMSNVYGHSSSSMSFTLSSCQFANELHLAHSPSKSNTFEKKVYTDTNSFQVNCKDNLTSTVQKYCDGDGVIYDSSRSKIEKIKEDGCIENKNAMSREEIVARRKLKVAARKQLKKLKKQASKELTGIQATTSDFSLSQTTDDFPLLSDSKTKKRTGVPNTETYKITEEVGTQQNLDKHEKALEKSWKPKTKDPIYFDLIQALQHKPEKSKPTKDVIKKTDPTVQRKVLSGNILDSDKPQMNKGKVRPDKIQKPSKLKSHILTVRNERCTDLPDVKQVSLEPCGNVIFKSLVSADQANNNLSTNLCVDSTANIISVEESKNIDNDKEICNAPKSVHSRRFREYCTNCPTEEIIVCACALLEKIAYFQDRTFSRDPIKASAKRRYVAGINQTRKYLLVKKVKLLVIAPDLEKNPGVGGLDEIVHHFIMEAGCQNVPCVFGPNRKRLGRAVKKNTLVSCVAVLSYEGAEEQYSKVLEELNNAKLNYHKLIGYCKETAVENEKKTSSKDEDSCTSASDITSSLLATLIEELAPADKLLNALHCCSGKLE